MNNMLIGVITSTLSLWGIQIRHPRATPYEQYVDWGNNINFVFNWTLNTLNPAPPWRSFFKPTQAPSSAAQNASTWHEPTPSWQQGPRTREAQLRLQKSWPKTNPLNLLVLIITIFPFLCQQAIVLVLDATAGPEPESMSMRVTRGIRNVFQRLYRYHLNRGQNERPRFRLFVENMESLMRWIQKNFHWRCNHRYKFWKMCVSKVLTRVTRKALLSEANFEKVFRAQNWARRSKLFCRWFCFLLGQAGCISVAAWTQLKLASYYFVSSGGLIVCCWKKALSLLQP